MASAIQSYNKSKRIQALLRRISLETVLVRLGNGEKNVYDETYCRIRGT